ncbi:MAG TPA: hypothetical protein VF311_15860 [Terriglobales bacterium]|jgi:hypothetical protein
MKKSTDEISSRQRLQPPAVGRMAAHEFQLKVLEKLGRLEAKVDMIVGNGQPGRMKLAEDRLVALEKNDLRRTVYDRLVTAAITFAISAIIAWHDRLGLK